MKNKGITGMKLIILVVGGLILIAIAINLIINYSNSQRLKKLEQTKSELLAAISQMEKENNFEATTSEKFVNLFTMNSLQPYVQGRVNGVCVTGSGSEYVFYSLKKNSYTLIINKDGSMEMYEGIVVSDHHIATIYIPDAADVRLATKFNNTEKLTWTLQNSNNGEYFRLNDNGIIRKLKSLGDYKFNVIVSNDRGEEARFIISDDLKYINNRLGDATFEGSGNNIKIHEEYISPVIDLNNEYEGEIPYTDVYACLYSDGTLLIGPDEASTKNTAQSIIVNYGRIDDKWFDNSRNQEFTGTANDIKKVTITKEIVPKTLVKMFYGMNNVTEINGLDKIETEHITDMSGMFKNCSSLQEIDLRTFNNKQAKLDEIFSGTKNLKKVIVGENWDVTRVPENAFDNSGIKAATIVK